MARVRGGGAVGGLEPFEAAYREHLPAVYRYLLRATAGDVALAEDLTQATFTVAARAFLAGDEDCLTPAWLRTVARSRLIDHHRRARREHARLSVVARRPAPPPGPIPDEVAGEAVRALRRIPTDQRLALALRYLDDLPVAEVARHLGRGVRATESLLVRGRAALRAAYEEERTDAG
jgi:RNA polymerase sigma-70 factor (ECF subfamily)